MCVLTRILETRSQVEVLGIGASTSGLVFSSSTDHLFSFCSLLHPGLFVTLNLLKVRTNVAEVNYCEGQFTVDPLVLQVSKLCDKIGHSLGCC